jgi:hypothetical protein
MSTRKVVFSDTLDTGYADDVGLSQSIPLTSIKEGISMGLEAKQLEEWATSNRMGKGLWKCAYIFLETIHNLHH